MSCLSSVLENLKDLNILADSFLVLPTVTCVTNMYVNTPLQKTSEKYGIFPLAKIRCASSRRLACLTHPCSVAILSLVFVVCLAARESARSLTFVRNSALTLT